MRKWIAGLFAVFAVCVLVQAQTWTMTITESTRGIPAQTISPGLITAWTNGITVEAGGYYSSSARTYMALVSGTSTNAPVHRTGVAAGADGISWLTCLPSFGQKGVLVCVMDGPEVHYNRGADATTNMPWTVKNVLDPARGDWRFIPADGGTSTVSFLEL